MALVHGDGQYAPERLPELIAPIAKGEAEAVFGSRMLTPGGGGWGSGGGPVRSGAGLPRRIDQTRAAGKYGCRVGSDRFGERRTVDRNDPFGS